MSNTNKTTATSKNNLNSKKHLEALRKTEEIVLLVGTSKFLGENEELKRCNLSKKTFRKHLKLYPDLRKEWEKYYSLNTPGSKKINERNAKLAFKKTLRIIARAKAGVSKSLSAECKLEKIDSRLFKRHIEEDKPSLLLVWLKDHPNYVTLEENKIAKEEREGKNEELLHLKNKQIVEPTVTQECHPKRPSANNTRKLQGIKKTKLIVSNGLRGLSKGIKQDLLNIKQHYSTFKKNLGDDEKLLQDWFKVNKYFKGLPYPKIKSTSQETKNGRKGEIIKCKDCGSHTMICESINGNYLQLHCLTCSKNIRIFFGKTKICVSKEGNLAPWIFLKKR